MNTIITCNHFDRLSDPYLVRKILGYLPIETSLLTRKVCRFFRALNRDIEFKGRYLELSYADYTFLKGREGKAGWRELIKNPETPLFKLLIKVYCTSHYALWQKPDASLEGFSFFVASYRKLQKPGLKNLSVPTEFTLPVWLELLSAACKQGLEWKRVLELPNADWIYTEEGYDAILDSAWKKTENLSLGVMLGRALVHGFAAGNIIQQGVNLLAILSSRSPEAAYQMAALHISGRGVQKNIPTAVQFLEEASGRGHLKAQERLYDMHEKGEGIPKNEQQAAHYALLLAKQGIARYQHIMGCALWFGKGVAEDRQKALDLFQLAADQHYAEAQLMVGRTYFFEKNYEKALHWLLLAAEQKSVNAQLQVGYMYEQGLWVQKNIPEALRWYRMAGNNGSLEAQVRLTEMCDYPDFVSEQFPSLEIEANVHQDASAQFCLGVILSREKGEEAAAWLKRAVDQDYALAQSLLGKFYLVGLVVKTDYVEAYRLTDLAAKKGVTASIVNAAYMLANGFGVEQDTEQAIALYKQAAEKKTQTWTPKLSLGILLPPGPEADRYFAEGKELIPHLESYLRQLRAQPSDLHNKILARLLGETREEPTASKRQRIDKQII